MTLTALPCRPLADYLLQSDFHKVPFSDVQTDLQKPAMQGIDNMSRFQHLEALCTFDCALPLFSCPLAICQYIRVRLRVPDLDTLPFLDRIRQTCYNEQVYAIANVGKRAISRVSSRTTPVNTPGAVSFSNLEPFRLRPLPLRIATPDPV